MFAPYFYVIKKNHNNSELDSELLWFFYNNMS
ncbi:MAG: hypothetical protein ACI9YE_003414 [Psychroserpens sp.]|jgi:hypothetical protein